MYTSFIRVFREVRYAVAPLTSDLKQRSLNLTSLLIRKEVLCSLHTCRRRREPVPIHNTTFLVLISRAVPSVQCAGRRPGELAEGPEQEAEVALLGVDLVLVVTVAQLLVDDAVGGRVVDAVLAGVRRHEDGLLHAVEVLGCYRRAVLLDDLGAVCDEVFGIDYPDVPERVNDFG